MASGQKRHGRARIAAMGWAVLAANFAISVPAQAQQGTFAPHLVSDTAAAETAAADDAAQEIQQGSSAATDFGDFSRYQSDKPTWTISADALFLQRSSAASDGILFDNNTGAEVINTSDLGLGTQAGPRLILLRQLSSGWTLDLEYFGIDGWSATENVPPGQYLLIGDESRTGPGVETAELLYASRFRTAEINLRAPGNGWIQPLAGFRWIGLSETYQSTGRFEDGGVNVTIPYSLRYETRNNLYGGQIGANALLWDRGGRLTISSLGKAGLFLSDSMNSATFAATFGPESLAFSGYGHRQSAAFFGELGVTANWQISEHLSLRAGYQLYWLTGVALAPNQATATDLVDGTGGINNSGDIFMHGPSAGLQLSW